MNTRLRFLLLGLPALLASIGCSSGEATPFEPDADLGQVSSALGEWGCRYSAPDVGFAYSGTIPEPGLVSPSAYSNPKCYKAYVTEIDNWRDIQADLIVADAQLDKSEWHARPATSGTLGSSSGSFFRVPPPIDQNACEALFLKAYLYENGVPISTRSAKGIWVPSSGFPRGYCQRPWVLFGGMNSRAHVNGTSDIDLLQPGREYKVAATLRSSDSSAASTLPIKVLTPPVTCGEKGLACCGPTADASCGPAFTTCQSNTCVECGKPGEVACHSDHDTVPPYCQNAAHQVTIVDDRCQYCGDMGDYCCDPQFTGTPACGFVVLPSGGLQRMLCNGSDKCVSPAMPPPRSSWDPNCGNQYHQCCPKESGRAPCKLAQTCTANDICDNLGPGQNYCVVQATAVIDQCSGGNNILPGERLAGCGTTLMAAQNAALLGFGLNNICLDNNATAGCCTYHFE